MKTLAVVLILSATTWAKTGTEVEVNVEIVSSDSAPQAQNRYQPSTLDCNNHGCTGAVGHSYSVIQDEVYAT